ncbi:MAG TPA: cytidine deaminase, partial [Geobacteraceae bacterium]
MPCVICSKMIINAGVRRIVYEEGYPDELAAEMMGESGVAVERFAGAAEGGTR